MRSTSVHRGDLVLVNQRGRLLYAKVLGAGAGGRLSVQPLERAAAVRAVRAGEVVDHWSRSTDADPGPVVGQISLTELDGWR